MTTLIFCAANNQRYAQIALDQGLKYGAQLPNTVYFKPHFVDQDWKNPNRDTYLQALKEHRPALASVLDIEHPEQFDEAMAWADEAAQYVTEAVIVIPKIPGVLERIPYTLHGKEVRIGYPVPLRKRKDEDDKFAGKPLAIMEYHGRSIHLLGGSPHKQYDLARDLNVASADGNYIMSMANKHVGFFACGSLRNTKNRYFPQLKEVGMGHLTDAPYHAFRLSCINLRTYWMGCTACIRYATPGDFEAIQKLWRQCPKELGAFYPVAIRESIGKQELYVAEYDGQMVGFIRWHKRRDGWITIYDVAVHPGYRNASIGSGLVNAMSGDVRLKCTADNPANEFYEHLGFTCTGTLEGKKRALNVWTRIS